MISGITSKLGRRRIKRVKIVPGCTSCGSCEAICPQVFEITDIAHVKNNAPIQKHEDLVREAAEMCPVQVIEVEEEEDGLV